MYRRYHMEPKERSETVGVEFNPTDAQELYQAGWIDDIDNDFGVAVGVVRLTYPSTDDFTPPREIHYRAFPGMWIIRDETRRRVLTAKECEKEWEILEVVETTPEADEFKPNPTPVADLENKGNVDTDDPHGVPEAMPTTDVDQMDEQEKAVRDGDRKHVAGTGGQTTYDRSPAAEEADDEEDDEEEDEE
jgi:hypothetical protein